jgi:hypothetical protein
LEGAAPRAGNDVRVHQGECRGERKKRRCGADKGAPLVD